MTTPDYANPEVIKRTLAAKTIAVVGLSANPARPSNEVAVYLQQAGYRVIPVNPRETSILGETCYPSLQDIPEPVHMVDVFRNAEAVPPIAKEAVAIGAQSLWLQLGVISPEGAAIASAGGLDVVMDRCTKIEHARYAHAG
ncbi:MAG: CoA-binding protein [Pseudomonadales bacterium]